MMSKALQQLEQALRTAAEEATYPPTPDVSVTVRAAIERRRRPTWKPMILRGAAIAILVLLAIILTVPQARALVAGWFRIGVIRVIPEAPVNELPQPPVTATPAAEMQQGTVRELSGITTLAEAQRAAGFRIQLPGYPPNLGEPHLVLYQPRLEMAVLVWMDESDPQRPVLSLYEFLSSNPIVKKIQPTVLAETSVNGAPALWLEGPYPIEVQNGDLQWRQIVQGRSLVWERDGVTYRLESALSMEESLKIAESID